MWRKVDLSNPDNMDFIAMGSTLLKNDKRFAVEINREGSIKGSTLVIGLANSNDAGQYVCGLGSSNKKEQKHTVVVRGKLIIFFHSVGISEIFCQADFT